MTVKKYIIGVMRESGTWCYAPNVTDLALPLFTFNRRAAREFVEPEDAKTWWNKIHNLFYEYHRNLPTYKWETLSILEIIESEEVFSRI